MANLLVITYSLIILNFCFLQAITQMEENLSVSTKQNQCNPGLPITLYMYTVHLSYMDLFIFLFILGADRRILRRRNTEPSKLRCHFKLCLESGILFCLIILCTLKMWETWWPNICTCR